LAIPSGINSKVPPWARLQPPPYATLYFGIHQLKAVPHLAPSLKSYSRYIDDVLGAWTHDADPVINRQNYLDFEMSMNSFGKLKWTFTPLQKEIAFMDLTLRVTHNGIQTWLFEKPLNLFLYIPSHLAHAPGILCGLVFGITECIFCLTSRWRDKQSALRNLFLRLCTRGYTSTQLCPRFESALAWIDNRPLPDPWYHEK
jgi:hypothetical protein